MEARALAFLPLCSCFRRPKGLVPVDGCDGAQFNHGRHNAVTVTTTAALSLAAIYPWFAWSTTRRSTARS